MKKKTRVWIIFAGFLIFLISVFVVVPAFSQPTHGYSYNAKSYTLEWIIPEKIVVVGVRPDIVKNRIWGYNVSFRSACVYLRRQADR